MWVWGEIFQNSTASEQNDVLFLENKGTTVPLRIYPTYLSTLSHKRHSEKKEDHHGEAVRQVQRHGYFKLAASPGQPLRDGLAGDPYEGFYLIT